MGQTKRHLLTRIKEHQSDIKKHPSSHSVVSKHRTSLAHEFNWKKPDILHSEPLTKKREIAEMFFIRSDTSSINLKKDTENLSLIYNLLLENI